MELAIIRFRKLEKVGKEEVISMKHFWILFTITLLLVEHNCFGQIEKIRNSSWISVDYIEQMKNRLPCECFDSINYCYYISIASKTINNGIDDEDDRIPEVIMNYIIQTDGARMFYIISEDSTKYVIANGYKKWNSIIELTLGNDTLLVNDKSGCKKYIKSSIPFNYHTDNLGVFVNISLLNKALSLRGYPSIQSILKEDSLSLDCNGRLGDINMIYSQEKPQSWVLEITDGYLFIRKVLSQCKDPLDLIKTKVIKILKWDINSNINIPKYKKNKVFNNEEKFG